jgi:hypothetical protein
MKIENFEDFKNQIVNFFSTVKIDKILRYFGICFLVLAVLIGGFTRIYGVFNYNQFRDDQSRDSFVYAQMHEGKWPTLGPGSSVGGYSLSPIYYYLNYIFSFGSLDPAMQAFPNSLFEFLSIPLFFYFLLLLLNGFKSGRSWFIAGFATLWWSVFFQDLVYSSMEWNPSSIPFFLMLFVIFAHKSISLTVNFKNNLQTNVTKLQLLKDCSKPALWWFLTGLSVAILTGLHSTTLMVTPVVLGLVSIYTIWKARLYAFPLILSWLTILLAHILYIQGEIGRNWENTHNFIQLIQKPQTVTHTIFERIDRSIFNYLDWGNLAFFDRLTSSSINNFFLSLVLGLAVLKFKGNRLLWAILWAFWLVYSYAVSNFWSYIFPYYKFPIWLAPIIFVVIFLNYFDTKKIREWILAMIILIFSLNSLYFNFNMSKNLLGSRLNNERTAITSDMIAGLRALPENSTLCLDSFFKQPFEYINQVYTKDKAIKITDDCSEPQTIKLHPKFEQNYTDLTVYSTPSLNSNQVDKIYFENRAVVFYSSK